MEIIKFDKTWEAKDIDYCCRIWKIINPKTNNSLTIDERSEEYYNVKATVFRSFDSRGINNYFVRHETY